MNQSNSARPDNQPRSVQIQPERKLEHKLIAPDLVPLFAVPTLDQSDTFILTGDISLVAFVDYRSTLEARCA